MRGNGKQEVTIGEILARENRGHYHLGMDYPAPERSRNRLREIIVANI